MLTSEITAKMVNHLNGTYSYTFFVNNLGNVSIQVVLAGENSVKGTISDSFDYDSGPIFPISSDLK